MEPSSEVKRQILKEYNRDPTGWHVFTARDLRGHVDTFFVRGNDVWFLKEEPVSPYESVGFGAKAMVPGSKMKLPVHSFGFRPVNKRLIEGLVSSPPGERMSGVVEALLSQRPVPMRSIRTPVAIEGPVMFSPKAPDVIPQQAALDLKLRHELDNLLARKYPHLLTTYR